MAPDTLSSADMLAQAEAALHNLLIGAQAVEVMADGYLTKYSPANIAQLRAYVARLQGGVVNTVRISSRKGLESC